MVKIVALKFAPSAVGLIAALSDYKGQKITIVGQAKNFVVINWSDLPH